MDFDLPPDLDRVADQWRDYIERNIEIEMKKELDVHKDGTSSIYVVRFEFVRISDTITLYYVGQTTGPNARADQHKSEMKNCKATTRIGKSKLYSARYFEDLQRINMKLTVVLTGLDSDAAKVAEKDYASKLRLLYGEEAVLSRPQGKKTPQPKKSRRRKNLVSELEVVVHHG